MRNLACDRSRQLSLVALKGIARDVERIASANNRTTAGAARHSQRPRQPRRGVDQLPHPYREPSHIDRHRPPHLRTKDADNGNREHRRRSPHARHAYEDRDLTPQELTADDAAHSRTPVTARFQPRATAECDAYPLHNEPYGWWHQCGESYSQSACLDWQPQRHQARRQADTDRSTKGGASARGTRPATDRPPSRCPRAPRPCHIHRQRATHPRPEGRSAGRFSPLALSTGSSFP